MANTSLFRKILIAGFCLATAFSASAFEYARMRIPDSLKPVVVEGESDTVAMPIAGGGVLKVQNVTGPDSAGPIPVRTKDAVDVILKALPRGKSIAAEVSGTTWFACAYEPMEMDGAMQQFFEGPIVVNGYYFILYIRVPEDRGLDATVRSMLKQITLLPPQDGNEEPAAPLVKMDKAKVPPVDIIEWREIVAAAKRKSGKTIEKPREEVASKPAEPLPPLPAIRKARAVTLSKPVGDAAFMGGQSRRTAIALFRELMRELVGPMSDAANAKFEAKWAEAINTPSTNVSAWIEKAMPIVSQMVQVKAAMNAAMVEYDETFEEARTANEFGSPAEAHALFGDLSGTLGGMDALREQLKALGAQLDELGEMPKPAEEKKAARRATSEARKVLKELVGEVKKEKPAAEAKPTARKPAEATEEYWVLEKETRHYGWVVPLEDGKVFIRTTKEIMGRVSEDECVRQGLMTRDEDSVYRDGDCKVTFGLQQIDYSRSYNLWATKTKAGKTTERKVGSFKYKCQVGWSAPKVVKLDMDKRTNIVEIAVTGSQTFTQPLVPGKKDGVSIWFGGGCDDERGYRYLDGGTQKLSCKLQNWRVDFLLCLHFGIPAFKDKQYNFNKGGACDVRFSYKKKYLTKAQVAELLAQDAEPVPEVVEEVEDEKPSEDDKAERIEFHRENIRTCQATIERFQAELAKESDSSRRSALEFAIIGEQSNIIYEQDCIRAEETGEFTISRTPFDDMCQIQSRMNSQRQIDEWERDKRIRNRAIELADKLPAGEKASAERLVEKMMDDNFSDTAQWQKLGDAMEKKYMGYLEHAQAIAESDVADREERIATAQKLKTGCDIVLALGSMGVGATAAGASKGIMYAYQAGTGYIEDGVSGMAKNVITTYSDVVDVAWSTYDGYKEGGWQGALLAGGLSVGMNYGLPYLAGKVNWSAEISFKKGTKPDVKGAKVSAKSGDVKAYEAELKKADADISDFVAKRNQLAQMKSGGKASQAQIAEAENVFKRSVAKVNANPVAKNKMKYDPMYKKVGAEFDANLQRMKTAAEVELVTEMSAKGYGAQKFTEFRNASSKGTVGMDMDLGVVETPDLPFTKNGKRISKYKYQEECQKTLDEIWRRNYGQSAQDSWMNITTSAHPEAYRNPEILKYSKDLDNMEEILGNMSRSDLQQAWDVTGYKANEMMKLAREGKMPRLVALQESARGTAKDFKTKVLPVLDGQIKALRAKAAQLAKSGKALSKTDAHNLSRYEAARASYNEKMDVLERIGNSKIDYTEWDDAMRGATGGKGITDFLKDMSDFMSSIK